MTPAGSGSLAHALFTAASFVCLLLVVIAIARFKKIPLPLTPPALPVIVGWICLFVVVAVLEEMIDFGGAPASRWDALTPARAIRAATIVLIAPLAEEVAFRGTMFGNFLRKGLSPTATILLTSALFAAVHLQYFGPGLLILFTDGVVFGLARHRTKSLFVPILLHTLGNAYAVGERILG